MSHFAISSPLTILQINVVVLEMYILCLLVTYFTDCQQLEQMDLEARDLEPRDRQKYSTRLKSYKSELNKLEKDLVCTFS